ncbi:serine/threonine protein kinase [Alteromonadaceae bacterium Bs31]|nr:serine/threonine protein kinase [Alteromonadaceae bacterium Bs31]
MSANKLITFLASLSLRAWVLIIGLMLALIPASFISWTSKLNSPLFVASSYLIEAPKGGANIGLIKIPDAELRAWQQDIHSAGKLGALLSNILHSSDATVGLLLPGAFDLQQGVADTLLNDIAKSSSKGKSAEQAKELLRRKQLLLDTLRSKRVVVGSHLGLRSSQEPVAMQAGALERLATPLRNWFWPPSAIKESADEMYFPQPGLAHYPLFNAEKSERQLIAFLGEELSYGEFLAYYLFAAAKLAGEASDNNPWSFYWQRDKGLALGDKIIATSPQGRLLTYNTVTERLTPLFNSMSLEEGLARGAFPDYVLIAGESAADLQDLASASYSMLNGKLAYQPWWFVCVSTAIFLSGSLLLVFLSPRVSLVTGLLSVSIILMLMLISQMVLAANKGWWLPMAGHCIWIFLSFVLMRMWCSHSERNARLQLRADEAGVYMAAELMAQGQLEEVPVVLDCCSSNKMVLQKYYDLGTAYAGKKQYAKAIETFTQLQAKSKSFRDTEQKIQTFQNMLAAPPKTLHDVVDVASTVVINPRDMQQKVLGRYEILQELGRGAMGIVYLGFDPKIARQVAIKTLKFNQFQPDQIEELKLRFFREAEAAGRLNHPHIVSVYDVGEETDLAFIAMDYVEGRPLSSFVKQNNLLPPFEVYRLIADVAEALQYAHGNNIVHRDIKPGNIMYNPSPYQVKVTDFGIARLVDDSKTSTGEILGSPLYMSPEQLKGKKVNHSADIFSLGVTFYQLLTGKLPFAGDNLASLTYEIIHGRHRGVRTVRKELPASASRITNQCLQKDATDRYDSAAELAMVLKKTIKRDFASEARKAGYL